MSVYQYLLPNHLRFNAFVRMCSPSRIDPGTVIPDSKVNTTRIKALFDVMYSSILCL